MGMASTAFQVIVLLAGVAERHLGPHALSSGSLSILLGLLVPCCGFFGATRSNHPCMCCFCSSSLVAALAYAALMVVFFIALWQTDESIQASCDASCKVLGCGQRSRSCSCEQGCERWDDMQCCQDFAEVCPLSQASIPEHISCANLKVTLATANVIVVLVLFAIIAPGIGLSVYAWYHGMMLWRRLVAGEVLVAGGAVALADSNCGEDFGSLASEHPPAE